jgi:hypothetical protein
MNCEESILLAGRTKRGKWVFWDQYGIVSPESKCWAYSIPNVKIIPETIGMKYDKCDKNGKPIYVGDIIELVTEDREKITIECKFGTVQRQIYENLVEITGFYFERSNDGRKTFPIVNNYLGKHDTEICEVIGTIFDVKEEAR